MIIFLTTAKNATTIGLYLHKYGTSLAPVVKPITYQQAFLTKQFPAATYLFADLELLSDRGREAAARVWQQLADHGCRVLNHPTRTLRRYELLRMLHQQGINRFNVYRAADQGAVQRFPVFLRSEHFHTGSQTDLLHTPAELAATIDKVQRAGASLNDVLITEYISTADSKGLFRKYGAFIVGDQIIARHLFFSRSWQVKDWDLLDPPYILEEQQYVETNPHAEQLRPIFAAAQVDYGRIDYSLLGERLQTWEINTNPIIVGQGTAGGGVRQTVHARFSEQFQAAMRAVIG